jgi:hypothetical protein
MDIWLLEQVDRLRAENDKLKAKSERLKVIVGKLESCDTCASQEGRHYCLLKGVSIKNMDITVCDEWTKTKGVGNG